MENQKDGFINVSGVVPALTASAAIDGAKSENGIGALMPWAGKLWYITYVAHGTDTGSGSGLFTVDKDFQLEKHPASVVGTYANRLMHHESNQLAIGPHLIDWEGRVRTLTDLIPHRLTATMTHLTDPENKLYYLTMEGLFYEADVHTLEVKFLYNLLDELGCSKDTYPHFKGGFTRDGSVVVANNTYDEKEYRGIKADGRLASWEGGAWEVLETQPFYEVTGIRAAALYATGWDRASALLKVFRDGSWSTYRLPKATHAMDHMWYTEWPRIREVETERLLMDCHGMFYELPHMLYEGKLWGVRPIAAHLRMIPDFCSWRGMLVLAGNQVTPIHRSNLLAGEPQSNLWFGKTDDLWQFGKPAGWGGPWWESPVEANKPSDPYLMTGFDKKVLHLIHQSDKAVTIRVEVDFLGNSTFHPYSAFTVPAGGYVHHEFPTGFSAHWVRLVSDTDCTATGYFVYT